MLEPSRLAAVVLSRLSSAQTRVNAYWRSVPTGRDQYAAELERQLEGHPVAVVVVRGVRFDNPNALLNDFVELVESARHQCERKLAADKCALVMLARVTLEVGQVSSPVVLPEWFPVCGGQSTDVWIEDVTWTGASGLNAPEVAVDDIKEALWSLEGLLLRRVAAVRLRDHTALSSLFTLLHDGSDGDLDAVLGRMRVAHDRVVTATGFRPSLRDADSLVARIWRLFMTTPCDSPHGASKALARALALPAERREVTATVVTVILRPSSRDANWTRMFARNVITLVAASCQLVTAAAHAGEYPEFSVELLRTLSADLLASLRAAERVVRNLE